MATPKTTATKSVSPLAAIWGRDDKEVSAAKLSTAEKRIKLNASRTIIDLEELVGAASANLEAVQARSIDTHSFTDIVNASVDLTEAEEALALAVKVQKEFLG